MKKLVIDEAIVVEGRDDVTAVSEAMDALIIPTHGFGITKETWGVIEKAYREKGLIILTDPDHSGEEIRRKLTERFPAAIHAYVDRQDACAADDVGIENAEPAVIAEALEKALSRKAGTKDLSDSKDKRYATMRDLAELGLSGCDGASELRAAVTGYFGIGYGNAGALIKKLRGFGIGLDELKEGIEKIRK